MIILAASVVITLSNTGIINKANQAVDLTNAQQVQDLAALLWADAYMNNLRDEELAGEVTRKLGEQGVTASEWNITVTNAGITVTSKDNSSITLGSLINSAENYGDTVDYSVTVNGTIYDEWRVLYEDEMNGYVYLIANKGEATTEFINASKFSNSFLKMWSSAPSSAAEITNASIWMANWKNGDYSSRNESKCGSYILSETYWTAYKNTTLAYKDYVIGAIGSPSVEMFVASWNAKREATQNYTEYNVEITLTETTTGYTIKSGNVTLGYDLDLMSTTDTLYFTDECVWIGAPRGMVVKKPNGIWYNEYIDTEENMSGYFRPVVCLRSDVPATLGTTTDFSLVK